MRHAIKKEGETIEAYQFGAGTQIEQELIDEGAIIKNSDGTYEVFSQEAVNGGGEIAKTGDYFKVDNKEGKRFPYPNGKEWFEEHHKLLSGNLYEQIPEPVAFYQLGDPMPSEIQQLMDEGVLKIDTDDPARTFTANIWGTELSVPSDGAVIIYGRKDDGTVDFNLIQAEELSRDYCEI